MDTLVSSSSRVKKIVAGVITCFALAPLVASCAAASGAMSAVGAGGKCPDLKPEAIMAFDYKANFSISAEAAAKLKAATAAAVEIKDFADGIDADLKGACGQIAKDLGSTEDFKDGQSACNAAIKVMGDVKAKIGANAKIDVVIKPPKCAADMNVMADCAGKCDVKASGPSAKVECEPGKLSGSCSASCEGSCDVQAGAKCDGQCSGTCDAEINGTCSGKCDGKCDGKTSKGASCSGTCQGKCDAQVKAECKGKCGGSCQLKAGASCTGTCNGKCSTEMKAPKCTGEVKPPQMSADCKAHCDAQVNAKMECTPAQVGIVITGAADADASAKFKATLEKNLPVVLKVAIGMGDRVGKMAANVSAVVDGIQGGIKDIAASAGGKAALTTGQLTACFGGVFKDAVGAAGSLQGNLKVSASVSASASGSAGTK